MQLSPEEDALIHSMHMDIVLVAWVRSAYSYFGIFVEVYTYVYIFVCTYAHMYQYIDST